MGGIKDSIPAEPFAAWLDSRVDYWERRLGYSEGRPPADGDGSPQLKVCLEVGWEANDSGLRRLYRMRNRITESSVKDAVLVFNRWVVQEALHNAGVHLGEIYPYEALVDEFVAEYLIPRDLAQRLANEWIDSTWQAVWNRVGLFVTDEDRPRCYCRSCKKTTRLFMGTCGECGAVHSASVVAAVTVTAVKPSDAPITDEIMAQARWLRQQYQLPYHSIAAVMAVYHGVPRSTETWRKTLRQAGAEPKPRGVPFKGVES